MPTVEFRVEGRVAVISINRPERRNAVDRATADRLVSAFQEFDAREDLDVAVLTGNGGHFCAGADLKAIAEGQGNRVEENGNGPMGPTRMLLSKPVIAAIEGSAVAGGLELALWCDLRVIAQDAVLGVFCRRFGVPLIDGGTIRLPRLIGHSHAMDLILTGRPVHADEALHIGLANRVTPPGRALEQAIALANELTQLPQFCLRQDRLSAYRQWDLDQATAIQQETQGGLEVIKRGETFAGATAFRNGKGRHGEF